MYMNTYIQIYACIYIYIYIRKIHLYLLPNLHTMKSSSLEVVSFDASIRKDATESFVFCL
jgi:hypothetical protein